MKAVEVRRHSVRDTPAEELSASGRALAAEVGGDRGPFRTVITSPSRRAVETAESMGFPIDRTSSTWENFGSGAIPWPLSFDGYGDQLQKNPAAARLAGQLLASVRETLASLGDGEQALVVTHGGFPELVTATVASRPRLVELGPACKCMEGVKLGFQGPNFAEVEPLRVPPARTRL